MSPRSLRLSSLALALAFAPSLLSAATPPPVPRTGPPTGELDAVWERVEATAESLGVLTSAQSAAIMAEAAAQRRLYADRFTGSSPRGVPTWRSIGPVADTKIQNYYTLHEQDSGRLRGILVDPGNPESVYVLAAGGGLWHTRAFSRSSVPWEPLTDFVGTTSGGSVAFGRVSSTIYLGTGDPFDYGAGGFVVTSFDSGAHWSDPAVFAGATTVLSLGVDTSARRDIVLAGTDAGLFRSADGGRTYAPAAELQGTQVWSLVRTRAGWLASALPSDGSLPSFTNGNGLWLSSDRGATWKPAGAGMPPEANRTTLAVGRPGDATVYAFAATDDDVLGYDQLDLFRSDDGGLTFTALGLPGKVPVNPNEDQPDMDVMHGQAWYNQMVLVDPNDRHRNTVLIGGNLSSAGSTDGGATWTVLSNWLPGNAVPPEFPYVHADFHCAAMVPGLRRIFLGGDGGIFYSDDGAASFESGRNVGLSDDLVYGVISGGRRQGEALIGLQDLGTRYRRPNTPVWDQVLGGDGFGVAWSQANDANSMATIYDNNIYRATSNPPNDQGVWEYAAWDILDYFYNFFTPLVTPAARQDPTGQIFFTYSPTFVYVTGDGGQTWNIIGNFDEGNGYALSNIDGGPPFATVFRDVVHGMGVSPDLNHIGVAATGGHVVLTSDFGTTWRVIGLNALVPGFASFTSNVTWSSNQTVFVTSVNPDPSAVHVVRSKDGGNTWAAAQTGLPDVPVIRLLDDHADRSGRHLFAATLLGVYETRDAGDHWTLVGAGLPQVHVHDLYLSPDGETLTAGTYGRGVWKVDLGN